MMQTTSTIPISAQAETPWVLPSRGIVGMACLIIAESAIFLIFLCCFFPLLLTSIQAVRSIPAVYVNAGRNFGLGPAAMVAHVLYPAVIPQLIIGLRITLGVAWLVVVAAEMIAVNSGLGFLIVDARNAGNRYDLVVAGMVMIGVIGWLLDVGMRSLERVKSFRWGYSED